MKVRSLSELQDALDTEMGWRLKEIAALKATVSRTSHTAQSTLIRAGTALIYAHWEGFVKKTSEYYLAYINSLRLSMNELADPLIAISLRHHIEGSQNSQKFSQNIGVVDFFRNRMSDRYRVSLSTAIDTESNLNSSVFSNLAQYLCIDASRYEAKYHFIDESLLSRRNSIAHGEYLDLNSEEWKVIADEVLWLIRAYKTDIENNATLAIFKRNVN